MKKCFFLLGIIVICFFFLNPIIWKNLSDESVLKQAEMGKIYGGIVHNNSICDYAPDCQCFPISCTKGPPLGCVKDADCGEEGKGIKCKPYIRRCVSHCSAQCEDLGYYEDCKWVQICVCYKGVDPSGIHWSLCAPVPPGTWYVVASVIPCES